MNIVGINSQSWLMQLFNYNVDIYDSTKAKK